MQIEDAPRFKWRGFMLDESRSFAGADEVKLLLDTMAAYKLNRFHWHLTDSAGWRIEIKSYPQLTTVGGRGDESDPLGKGLPKFYTQDQIREIVRYAKERHITVIPEVREVMVRENLADNAAIEKWFALDTAAIIHKLGFTSGGWDEIAKMDLPPTQSLVFWWRHDRPGVLRQALAVGYPAVFCPRRPMYFDFLQSTDHEVGTYWHGINPFGDVNTFPEPLDLEPGLESKVMGIQACLWTENAMTRVRREFLKLTLSYAATASEVGSQLQIRIVENANNLARDGYVENFALSVTPIPEPGTSITMLCLGMFGLLLRRRHA